MKDLNQKSQPKPEEPDSLQIAMLAVTIIIWVVIIIGSMM